MNRIDIVDENLHISIFLTDNNIITFSNDQFDINKYLNYLKTANYSKGINYNLNQGNLNDDSKKIFRFGKMSIIISLSTLLFLHSILDSNIKGKNVYSFYTSMPDYTVTDLRNYIYSSKDLKNDEKDFLYNKEFLEDILQIINQDDYLKYMYSFHFDNIKIESFKDVNTNDERLQGYYLIDKPNLLYIKDYEKLTEAKKDTLSHEFIHLCQDISCYNLILEASTEIISKEYYNMPISCYDTQVKLLKKLMEVIGSTPIWEYSFSGDFSLIEERVKPYLSDDEYKEFLDDLTFTYGDNSLNDPKFKSLDKIIGVLYERIYGTDIKNDEIISLIEDNNRTLKRYYFNERYINKENSYYLDYDNGEYKLISLKEAMDNNIVSIDEVIKTPIAKETALKEINKFLIERVIDYNSAEIRISGTTFMDGKMYISGTINGVEYKNYDVDELASNNIISVDYYSLKIRELTASEYLNHEYNEHAEIRLHKTADASFRENEVYCLIPKKTYLRPINENVEKTKQYVLNK